MKKIIFVLTLLAIVSVSQNVLAVPDLKLPFRGGETWWCSQGNNGSYSHSGDLAYAWDFNFGAGSDDLGRAVTAPASGTIVYVYDGDGYNGGWGNTVIIDYGDNSYGKLSHLDTVVVEEGQSVVQGEMLGTCGGTGLGTGSHIHYQTQEDEELTGESIQSSFSDVSTNNGVPLGCDCSSDDGNHRYTSGNYYISMYLSTFPGQEDEGWSAGNNTEEAIGGGDDSWYVNVTGSNPGVLSPEFTKDVNAGDLVIHLRAKITGVTSYALGNIYVATDEYMLE